LYCIVHDHLLRTMTRDASRGAIEACLHESCSLHGADLSAVCDISLGIVVFWACTALAIGTPSKYIAHRNCVRVRARGRGAYVGERERRRETEKLEHIKMMMLVWPARYPSTDIRILVPAQTRLGDTTTPALAPVRFVLWVLYCQ
jgi:hypothetical protein